MGHRPTGDDSTALWPVLGVGQCGARQPVNEIDLPNTNPFLRSAGAGNTLDVRGGLRSPLEAVLERVEADRIGELIDRAREGDEEALSELLREHTERLLGSIRLELGDRLRQRLESQDVMQQVYLDALRDIDRFQERQSPGRQREKLSDGCERGVG